MAKSWANMSPLAWSLRDVRIVEVGYEAQMDEESEANYPEEAVMERLYRAWRYR